MYMQGIKKTTLSIFDDKKNYLNNVESIPWEYILINSCKIKRKI